MYEVYVVETKRNKRLFWYAPWVAIVVLIVSSFREPVPIFYGDSPAFVQSALLSISERSLTTVGGRDIGYPAILALAILAGGGLKSVVVFQQLCWAATILFVGWTSIHVTGYRISLLPTALLAIYPGSLLYRHLILSESLYSSVLATSTCLAVLSIQLSGGKRSAALISAVLFAAIAACLRSTGLAVLLIVGILSIAIQKKSFKQQFPLIIAFGFGLALAFSNAAIRADSPDPYSRQFVQKTMFCNHLNIFLSSESASNHLHALLGDAASDFSTLAERDLKSKQKNWPTLGFYGDACLFDTELDELANSGSAHDIRGAPNIYFSLFVSTVIDRPVEYLRKVIKQMIYGLIMAWPPHGSGPVLTSSEVSQRAVAVLLTDQYPSDYEFLQGKSYIKTWFLASYDKFANYLFRSVSLIIAFIVIIIPFAWIYRGKLNLRQLKQLSLVSIIWLSSISIPALAHTLDIWRYIVTSTPVAALMVALGGALVAGLFHGLTQRRFEVGT